MQPRLEARATTLCRPDPSDDIGQSLPPGTGKWNKTEHRLFCHITANWRGTPLTTHETVVYRIGDTRTAAGCRVGVKLDGRQ